MDDFTFAYIECALWSSTDDNDDSLDETYSIDDIEQESLDKIIAECKEFQEDNSALLQQAYKLYSVSGYTGQQMAGYDYWLTRNGHGAGFWDRGLGDVGNKLTEACKYQDRYLFANCDNKLDYM